MLGICRGHQLFNVMLGGTLFQDIKSFYKNPLAHDQGEPYHVTSHEVSIKRDTPISAIFSSDSILTNTAHHQAIKDIARGLESFAVCSDGIVEGLYHKSRNNFLSVQWHPEYLYNRFKDHRVIFETFINMCK